jgi:hypothetical protein
MAIRFGLLSIFPAPLPPVINACRIPRLPSSRSALGINDLSLQSLRIPAYDKWEADIVWNDEFASLSRAREDDDVDEALNDLYSYRSDDSRRWKRLATGSDETLSRKLRRVITPGNEQLARGLWVRGIVWGDGMRGQCGDLSEDEEEVYGDVVPLVHTANDTELYIPLPPSEQPDRDSAAEEALAAARAAAAAAEVAISAAANAVPQKPMEVVKGPLYRQQKAREKKERLDKLKALAFTNLKGGATPGDSAAATAAPTPLPQETAVTTSRRRRAATAELEHCILATRHLNCKTFLRRLEMRYFHRPLLSKQARLTSWQLTLERKGSHKVNTHTPLHVGQSYPVCVYCQGVSQVL